MLFLSFLLSFLIFSLHTTSIVNPHRIQWIQCQQNRIKRNKMESLFGFSSALETSNLIKEKHPPTFFLAALFSIWKDFFFQLPQKSIRFALRSGFLVFMTHRGRLAHNREKRSESFEYTFGLHNWRIRGGEIKHWYSRRCLQCSQSDFHNARGCKMISSVSC